VRTDFDGFFDQAHAAVVLPDGKIVAAGLARRQIGSTGGGLPIFRAEVALARYTAAGVLDASFGNGGVVRTDFGQDVDVRVLLRDPADGDLIAVGNTPSFPQMLVVARYDADGTPDASVGGGTGRLVTSVSGIAYTGLVLPDGKLMIGGSGRNASGFEAFLLARLHPDGTPDDGFDGDGVLVSNQGAGIRGMLREADGDLVVAGWRQDGNLGGFINFVAARFTATGAIDTTFGGAGTGRISIDFFNVSGGDQGRALARLPDARSSSAVTRRRARAPNRSAISRSPSSTRTARSTSISAAAPARSRPTFPATRSCATCSSSRRAVSSRWARAARGSR
jgi:uncharacterized delta-60 repeat protein